MQIFRSLFNHYICKYLNTTLITNVLMSKPWILYWKGSHQRQTELVVRELLKRHLKGGIFKGYISFICPFSDIDGCIPENSSQDWLFLQKPHPRCIC